MGKTFLIIAGTVVVVYLLLIAFGQAKNPFGRTANLPAGARVADGSEAYKDGDLKCELRGADGRTITITGSGPEFERLCRQQNQPVTLYGYQYYPLYYYRWYPVWGWRRHHGGSGGTGGTGM